MTSSTNTFTLNLDIDELVFIGRSIKASAFFLIDASDRSETPTDANKWLNKVQEGLISKGYAVAGKGDGPLTIDPTVPALVSALAFARSALVITIHAHGPDRRQSRHIYFTDELIVDYEEHENGSHLLTAVRDESTLLSRLQNMLSGASAIAPSTLAWQIEKETFEQVSYLVAKGEIGAATKRLQQAGMAADTARSAIGALSRPDLSLKLETVAFRGHKIRRYDTLHIALSAESNWSYEFFREEEQEYIQSKTISRKQLNRQLHAYIQIAAAL